MRLLEVQITPELLDEIRDFLFQEGHVLGVRDITTEFKLQAEFTRRSEEATEIAKGLIDLLERRAIKPLDLDVQDFARRTLKR